MICLWYSLQRQANKCTKNHTDEIFPETASLKTPSYIRLSQHTGAEKSLALGLCSPFCRRCFGYCEAEKGLRRINNSNQPRPCQARTADPTYIKSDLVFRTLEFSTFLLEMLVFKNVIHRWQGARHDGLVSFSAPDRCLAEDESSGR